jgi:uncharacterized membrane-anchored protein
MSTTEGTDTTTATVARGPLRSGRRTKDLIKQLRPGDVALIDHADLDRVAADGLVDAGVAAVVNAAPSITGRYPNGGPLRIVAAHIPLVDGAADAFDRLSDGSEVVVDADGSVRPVGARDTVARGRLLTREDIERLMEAARESIGDELERFAVNTLEYIEKEAQLTFAPLVLPELRTTFDGRHALVVVRGHDYREDLRALRAYIAEFRPVLIGVDGGADALLEMRCTPDIIIGDFDSLSERAWGCGAELVHHVHPDGRGPGREELLARGVDYHEFVVEGTSEDAAMLLAYENKARLVVAVGTHASMVEFLDKGRAGMSSTFLTRLRIGPMLVDAKGVSQLYAGRVRRRDLALLIAAGLIAILAVALASTELRLWFDGRWLWLREAWYSFTGRL